jgi:hypothetical protein
MNNKKAAGISSYRRYQGLENQTSIFDALKVEKGPGSTSFISIRPWL